MNALEIVKRAAGPAIATDEKSRIVGWNRAARELLECSTGNDLEREPLNAVLEARDVFGNRLDFAQFPFHQMVTRGEPVNGFEVNARKQNGEALRLLVSVVVVLGPKRGGYHLVYLMRPIYRRRKADEAIERILANSAYGRHVLDRSNGDGGDVPELTRRQTDVLRLLAQGHNNEEIAELLSVSVFTVRSHVQSVLDKLGVHSKVEAVSRAFRDHLI
ncbi:MAG TPA: LuxR C-terminal-related transcriptional regulator [Vicinamibacteria bacterium]|nr:LuxR C-terminal-related transcriptional regulator [Vicinamibacteria bacterium]